MLIARNGCAVEVCSFGTIDRGTHMGKVRSLSDRKEGTHERFIMRINGLNVSFSHLHYLHPCRA